EHLALLFVQARHQALLVHPRLSAVFEDDAQALLLLRFAADDEVDVLTDFGNEAQHAAEDEERSFADHVEPGERGELEGALSELSVLGLKEVLELFEVFGLDALRDRFRGLGLARGGEIRDIEDAAVIAEQVVNGVALKQIVKR